jgi:hypothetical protein
MKDKNYMKMRERMLLYETLGHRHFQLLVLLLVLIITRPILPTSISNMVFLGVMFVSAWLISKNDRRTRKIILILVLPFILLVLSYIFVPREHLLPYYRPIITLIAFSIIIFLLYCGFIMLSSLLTTKHAGIGEICGVINLYLILGFSFGYIYYLFEILIPGSFIIGGESSDTLGNVSREVFLNIRLFYFSFITLATQGYGDITPSGSMAQMIVVYQTVIGQLYVAIVIAYMISLHITYKMTQHDAKKENSSTTVDSNETQEGYHP